MSGNKWKAGDLAMVEVVSGNADRDGMETVRIKRSRYGVDIVYADCLRPLPAPAAEPEPIHAGSLVQVRPEHTLMNVTHGNAYKVLSVSGERIRFKDDTGDYRSLPVAYFTLFVKPEPRFKVGDRIECVPGHELHGITPGKVYIVTGVFMPKEAVQFTDDDGDIRIRPADHVRLATTPPADLTPLEREVLEAAMEYDVATGTNVALGHAKLCTATRRLRRARRAAMNPQEELRQAAEAVADDLKDLPARLMPDWQLEDRKKRTARLVAAIAACKEKNDDR